MTATAGTATAGVRHLQNNTAFVGIIQNGVVKIATDPLISHKLFLIKEGAMVNGRVMEGVRVFTAVKDTVGTIGITRSSNFLSHFPTGALRDLVEASVR